MSSSPQLSLSGCSSLFSLSSSSSGGRDDDSAGAVAAMPPLPPRRPLLSLSVGGGGDMEEEEEEGEGEEYLLGGLDLQLMGGGGGGGGGSSCDGDDERKTIRMMKNRESALRSRARKRAYVQELEKEVRRLVNENLKLKRQCKQLKVEMAALIQPSSTTKSSNIRRASSSTQL